MILFYGNREWAFNIFQNIKSDNKILVTNINYDLIEQLNPKFIFFVGWSYIIPEKYVNKYRCICLHPSPLPKYRGGSPIQHQILNNEKHSAVTYFIMNGEIDKGDIIFQKEINLDGNIVDIFKRISDIGTEGINLIIENKFQVIKQDDNSKIYRRRTPEQSEITIDEILNNSSTYLYNKIRCLQDPYPNAFIVCGDGKKLFLTESKLEK